MFRATHKWEINLKLCEYQYVRSNRCLSAINHILILRQILLLLTDLAKVRVPNKKTVRGPFEKCWLDMANYGWDKWFWNWIRSRVASEISMLSLFYGTRIWAIMGIHVKKLCVICSVNLLVAMWDQSKGTLDVMITNYGRFATLRLIEGPVTYFVVQNIVP